ncbi:hypothetical protein [Kiloniella sp. EL199]|uniref:hypothetical protein n=1 Tax=Kiloniella sp. EL199 TaxID=2107581 RepID=UPI0013C46147|nr:hypothetical protein [Kiloniella sp. EL199]
MSEMSKLFLPLEKLLESLTNSWGEPGLSGEVDEIHHSCSLIRDLLHQVLEHEERVRFISVSEGLEGLPNLLQDTIGSQIDKLRSIPNRLDEITLLAEDIENQENCDHSIEIKEIIEISLPPNWGKKISREMEKLEWILYPEEKEKSLIGKLSFFIIAVSFFASLLLF